MTITINTTPMLNHFYSVLKANNPDASFRSWLEGEHYSIYCRYSTRVNNDINGKKGRTLRCFDLATLNINPQRQGIFTSLLNYLEAASPMPLYIENVTDPRFKQFFRRRNYIEQMPYLMEDPNRCFISRDG